MQTYELLDICAVLLFASLRHISVFLHKLTSSI